MRTATIRWIACFALSASLGIPWAALQAVAWAGMWVRFAQQDDWSVALSKTFDGRHPCALCHAVQHARAEQREHSGPTLKPSFDAVLDSPPLPSVLHRPDASLPSRPVLSWSTRSDPPPRPRPRTAPGLFAPQEL